MKGVNIMENIIGKAIGIVSHSFSIKNDRDEKVTLNIKVDFRTCSDQDIKGWIVSNRIIAGQRPWRSLSLDELNELNGKTFNANTIGQKVKSRKEQLSDLVTTFVNAGVEQEKAFHLATAALDNPEALTIVKE